MSDRLVEPTRGAVSRGGGRVFGGVASGAGVSRKLVRVIGAAFGGLAVVGMVAAVAHHPRAPGVQRVRQREKVEGYTAEVPPMLTVSPADFAGFPPSSGPIPTQSGFGLAQPKSAVASRVPAGSYGLYPTGAQTGEAQILQPPQAQPPSLQLPIPPQANGGQGRSLARQGGGSAFVTPEDPAHSPLFFGPSGTGQANVGNLFGAAKGGAGQTPPVVSVEKQATESKYQQQNMASEKTKFLQGQTGDYGAYLNNRYITPVALGNELIAGTAIPMTMVTGINSDLPGTIIAQVDQNVYDSITGANILIPAGSKLIGSYDSAVAFGQNRVLVAWQRLLEPDGVSIELRGMPGTDLTGKAGLSDKVDYHLARLLAGLGLATVFNVGTTAAAAVLTTASFLQTIAAAAIAGSAANTTSGAAGQVVQQYTSKLVNQQPTITIRAGYRGYVIVNKDMLLPAYPDTTIPYAAMSGGTTGG